MKRCPTCGGREQRSTEQNRLYWKWVHRIAERYRPNGEQFGPDAWHIQLVRMFLGCADVRLPNGEVIAERVSTTELDVPTFAEFITQVEVFAAERGVHLDE